VTNQQENQENSLFIPYIVNIPGKVLESDLSKGAIKLFSLLCGLSNAYGYSFATNEKMSQHFKVNIRTIEKWMEKLRELEFIKCVETQHSYKSEDGKLRWKKNRKVYVSPAFLPMEENSKKVCDTAPDNRVPPIPPLDVGLLNTKHIITQQSTPTAVVVVSSLNQLKIDEALKIKISRDYSADDIDRAVNICLAWAGRPSDEIGIMSSLKNLSNWDDPISIKNGKITDKNRSLIEKWSKNNGKKCGDWDITVSNNDITFSQGVCCKIFSIEDVNFEEKIKKFVLDIQGCLGK